MQISPKANFKSIATAVVLVVLFIAIVAAAYLQHESAGTSMRLKVSGNIEATEVRLAFRVGGKVSALLADEGYMVKAGAVVARINTDELVKIKNQAEANFNTAKLTYDRAKGDYARIASLYRQHTVSAQDRDNAKIKLDTSKTSLAAMRAAFELAVTQFGFADLASPLDGFVLTKNVEVGEVIQLGMPAFTISDLKNIWLTAYVNETDLGRVKLNQSVIVKTDTYPNNNYRGRISFISAEAEFTPKQIQTNEERVKLVYRIKISIDNNDLELKPGMPADGFIIMEKVL